MPRARGKAVYRTATTITIDKFTIAKVQKYCRITGVPRSRVIEFAVLKYLGLEDEFNKELDEREAKKGV